MATKKTQLSKESIVSMYMDYVLEHNEKPKSVYLFGKSHNFTEAEFYSFFGNLESIEKEIYNIFFEKTIQLLHKDPQYENYDMKTKLLSFYYTFFEMLTANRSYISQNLNGNKNKLKSLQQLSDLRANFKNFIQEITTSEYRIEIEKVQKIQENALQESAWIQLLLTLKFWLEDNSKQFEKTDIYIEKSVNLSFELINLAPVKSLIDFGKFLFKEKFQQQ